MHLNARARAFFFLASGRSQGAIAGGRMNNNSCGALQPTLLIIAAASVVVWCYWAGSWDRFSPARRTLLVANAAALATAAAVLAHHALSLGRGCGGPRDCYYRPMGGESFVDTPNMYNEDLSRIGRDLMTYYSCFSGNSYMGTGTRWANLATALQMGVGSTCGANDYNDSHMRWESVPSFAPRDGFALGSNRAIGPESHRMGISAASAYSVFMFVRFTGLSSSAVADYELFNIYANTPTNNGLRLFVQGSTVQQRPGGARVVLRVEHGGSLTSADTVYTCALEGRSDIDIDFDSTYLLVIVKEYSGLRVHMYRAPGSSRMDLLNRSLGAATFKLSNQEIVLNRGANVNARVLTFGVYARALGDSELHELQAHMYAQLARLEPQNQETAATIATLKQEVVTLKEQLTSCPFDPPVCGACAAIKDWSNWGTVFASADAACLEAINRFCTANPSHPQCSCWNSNSAAYHTNSCRSYRGVFTDGRCYMLDALDDNALKTVKQRYNLCGCTEETPRRGPLGNLPPLQQFLVQVPSGGDGSAGPVSMTAPAAAAAVAGALPMSGFTGDTSSGIVNYFNTARDPRQNSSIARAMNSRAATKPVKRVIADPFAGDDPNISGVPLSKKGVGKGLQYEDEAVKPYWQSFLGSDTKS